MKNDSDRKGTILQCWREILDYSIRDVAQMKSVREELPDTLFSMDQPARQTLLDIEKGRVASGNVGHLVLLQVMRRMLYHKLQELGVQKMMNLRPMNLTDQRTRTLQEALEETSSGQWSYELADPQLDGALPLIELVHHERGQAYTAAALDRQKVWIVVQEESHTLTDTLDAIDEPYYRFGHTPPIAS